VAAERGLDRLVDHAHAAAANLPDVAVIAQRAAISVCCVGGVEVAAADLGEGLGGGQQRAQFAGVLGLAAQELVGVGGLALLEPSGVLLDQFGEGRLGTGAGL
jgi:hypothetical protein